MDVNVLLKVITDQRNAATDQLAASVANTIALRAENDGLKKELAALRQRPPVRDEPASSCAVEQQ